MALRACDFCGAEYSAVRPGSRFCGATCRKRSSRAGGSRPPPAAAVVLPVATGGGAVLSLYDATLAELTAAGRAESALGRSALLLARRLDGAVREPGMGMAALAKQHEQTLAGAVRGAARAADPVDELKAARDRKRAG